MAVHRKPIGDFSIVMAIGLGAIYLALTYDIFANAAGRSPQRTDLEIDELALIAGTFLVGFAWALWRISVERREAVRRVAHEREMRALAYQDALTGLPNRRQFEADLRDATKAPPRNGASHALFMLDLNAFKKVNDAWGHAAGDEILIQVGASLAGAVRRGDVVARLGGDEFAVLATHVSGAEAATGIARNMIAAIERPMIAAGRRHAIGTSIGIALTPQDGTEPAELLRKADIALYRGKGQGRSEMCFFETEMDAQVRERDLIERELAKAIENGSVVPHYQPMMDMKTKQVIGFEALARWTHSEFGDLPPSRFVPIAEDAGLIAPMTDALLARALADAVSWPTHVRLAYNLSPALLRDQGFALRVMHLLGCSGLAPHRLELEITESALVRDMPAAQAILGVLREAGVRIALDDFGTGYSSLYHLRNFQVDKIKIDQSFIAAMGTDPRSAAIVRALIGLGTGMELEVTAEGVETDLQDRTLADQGCDQAQGFFYSEALSASQTLTFLAGRLADDTPATRMQTA